MAVSTKELVERLFVTHRDALLAFMLRRAHRPARAAELAQEVFLRMLRVEDATTIRHPEAYLFTVASNVVKEYAAQDCRDGQALDLDNPAIQEQLADLPAFGAHLDTQRRIQRLHEVLEELPVKCRAVVLMAHWQQRSYEEIGESLGISTHMVKKYLTQALVHCRRRMGRLR